MRKVLDGYAASAADLSQRFEAISSPDLYAAVDEYLPGAPSRALDVGAGSGRDAAWLCGLGHDVWAVEPVAELRCAARKLRPDTRVRWIDDSLPQLSRVLAQNRSFELVIVSAVWQHLELHDRLVAMRTLATLLSAGGKLIISLRHGPGVPARPCFPCEPSETISSGSENGLLLICERAAASAQVANRAVGVAWTWLVFTKCAA